MAIRDLYTNGNVINYREGDSSLHRNKVVHSEDLEDAIHTITQGETLTYLANRYYKDPKLWYLIADVNDIENPMCLKIGLDIIIPNYKKYNL